MHATTAVAPSATVVGVDLAKSVFQLAVADASWRVVVPWLELVALAVPANYSGVARRAAPNDNRSG